VTEEAKPCKIKSKTETPYPISSKDGPKQGTQPSEKQETPNTTKSND
jgi:hypothetical protein